MKRSASACFGREKKDEEHAKKIIKSVQPKKTASKEEHKDVVPSPTRQKKDDQKERPLGQLPVNEGPTKKELAAAKAARIRLGYEELDSEEVKKIDEEKKLPSGVEPSVTVEVEYLATEDLQPLEDVESVAEAIMNDLATKDWTEMCRSLNVVRRLAVHHPSQCKALLSLLVPAVLKMFKNPRSSVCKTAVLCLGDLVQSMADDLVVYLDAGGLERSGNSVLCQLLLKSSADKQFVTDEIQRVFFGMAQYLSTIKLVPLLIPYASAHKNPKVRGKAASILSEVTQRMTIQEADEIGIPRLLKTAASLVSDKTPDAREAARLIISRLHFIQSNSNLESTDGAVTVNVSLMETGKEEKEADGDILPSTPWRFFCEEHLTMTEVIAVLKVSPN